MMIRIPPDPPPVRRHHHHHHHHHDHNGGSPFDGGYGQPLDIMQLMRDLLQNNRWGGGGQDCCHHQPRPFFGAQCGPHTGSCNFGGGLQF